MDFDIRPIYKYIDEYGIPFDRMSKITISFEIFSEEKSKQESENFIKLKLPFSMSQEEQIDLVLNYVYDLTAIRVSNVNELLKLKSLNNKPFILEIENNKQMSVLYVAFKKIPGSLVIRGDQSYKDNGNEIKTLGNIEYIDGSLGLSYTQIENLGELKEVTGDFWFSGDEEFNKNGFKIKTLSPLEIVQGAMSIRGKSLETLGTLKSVGKNLSLRYSNVRDLGNLEFVGGNLLLSKYNFDYYDLSKVKICGQIKKYNDNQ